MGAVAQLWTITIKMKIAKRRRVRSWSVLVASACWAGDTTVVSGVEPSLPRVQRSADWLAAAAAVTQSNSGNDSIRISIIVLSSSCTVQFSAVRYSAVQYSTVHRYWSGLVWLLLLL